jgi:2-amino-4-hydroxy-6-hydroxymethyldihydropteridine diphosphokinase
VTRLVQDPLPSNAVFACVAIGANLGDAATTVMQAMQTLQQLADTSVVKCSSLYRTAPHEAQGPDFINAAVLLRTHLAPLALLHALQAIENQQGRERPYKNAPRTLDLDLIFYGDVQLQTSELTLPHPRWHNRAFVLHPLADIWPERVSAAMLQAVADQAIEKVTHPQT